MAVAFGEDRCSFGEFSELMRGIMLDDMNAICEACPWTIDGFVVKPCGVAARQGRSGE